MTVISLLTDFGTRDGYVGIMRGVILRLNPAATVLDLCHNVLPQDVAGAAFILSTAYPYFAPDTIHVVVVDPGVGSKRRAIALRTERGTFVAPDNGVLSYVLAFEACLAMVALSNPEYWLTPVSRTFHGRDVFAPVAAHISLGVPLYDLGAPVDDPVQLPIPQPRLSSDGCIIGQVVHVDHFGNLITNVPHEMLPEGTRVGIGIAGRSIAGPEEAYAAAADGELLALIGSSGNLEVALRNGSAASALGTGRDTEVVVLLAGSEDKARD